jgi:hypothetical protein
MIYFDSLSVKLSQPYDPMIMFNWLTQIIFCFLFVNWFFFPISSFDIGSAKN